MPEKFRQEDLVRNDVWRQLSMRKSYNAFLINPHSNVTNIVKKAPNVNTTALVEDSKKPKKGKKKAKCQVFKERLEAKVILDDEAWEIHEKNQMDHGNPIYDIRTNE